MVKQNGYAKEKEEKYIKKLKVIKEIFKSLTKRPDDKNQNKSQELKEQNTKNKK